MQIAVTFQTKDLPEEIRKELEALPRVFEDSVKIRYAGTLLVSHGSRTLKENFLPVPNAELKIEVPDIDDGTTLPDWMKGVYHKVELMEMTCSHVQQGRFRYGGAHAEVNSYETNNGHYGTTFTCKIRINARGKHAYPQALALLGKLRSGELVSKYKDDLNTGRKNMNVKALWD